MAKNNFYLTTPIYYVNDVPHIGHAYTSIAADVLARYQKLQGRDVFFLTGTDEHGAKIAEAAQKAKKTPKEFVDELVPRYKKAWEVLNISYDEFFRTTNKKHEAIVQDFIKRLQDAGYIEKRQYQGWYCVGCEKYLAPEELKEGKCPDHKKEPIWQSEENYFFLLSKAASDKKLYEKIEKDQILVSPKARKNEVLGKIKAGLEDVSISRENVEWGVKFPGDDTQTVYVWVDALINYLSATQIYKGGPSWPADLHLMAKDILWFHAIIWPAMLLAVGQDTPKQIFAHGFFTINGEKMSKTVGNVLDPIKLVEKYGTDAVRYALLREFPFGEDGDISEEKIALRYQNDLANDLGNLVQRSLTMINKYDIKPEKISAIDIDISDAISELRFDLALEYIWIQVRGLNIEIDKQKPWELAKGEPEKLAEVLNGVYEELWGIAEALVPFMPETAERMQKQLETLVPEPLFPRLDS